MNRCVIARVVRSLKYCVQIYEGDCGSERIEKAELERPRGGKEELYCQREINKVKSLLCL